MKKHVIIYLLALIGLIAYNYDEYVEAYSFIDGIEWLHALIGSVAEFCKGAIINLALLVIMIIAVLKMIAVWFERWFDSL